MTNITEIKEPGRAADGCHYLTEKQLARRLNMSVKWCQKQRLVGGGVPFTKFGTGAVRYAISDIEEYEKRCRRTSTSDPGVGGGMTTATRKHFGRH